MPRSGTPSRSTAASGPQTGPPPTPATAARSPSQPCRATGKAWRQKFRWKGSKVGRQTFEGGGQDGWNDKGRKIPAFLPCRSLLRRRPSSRFERPCHEAEQIRLVADADDV